MAPSTSRIRRPRVAALALGTALAVVAAVVPALPAAAVTVAVGPALKAGTTPTITGTAKVGHKLTAAHGTWSPTATSYTYVWKRDGKTVTGAARSTYVLVKADKGHKVSVKVTAKRSGWTNGSGTTAAVTVR